MISPLLCFSTGAIYDIIQVSFSVNLVGGFAQT